jgi:hypothetical protein
LIAFDDSEMSEWLVTLAEDRSGHFLCALSEAVIRADDEDYSIIRPALVNLKHKYSGGRPRLEGVGKCPRRQEGSRPHPKPI